MRLQSAVFTLEDTLFTLDGTQAREGLDKVLSIFKMEGVWLGSVTALDGETARQRLERAGLASDFRFVLTEAVALCPRDSGTMFERAMKRLHAEKGDTVVFSGSLCAARTTRTGTRCVPPRQKAWSITASCWAEAEKFCAKECRRRSSPALFPFLIPLGKDRI